MATEPIYEVTLIGLQRDKRVVLDFLQTSGLVHVKDVTDVEQDEPLGIVPEIAGALLTVKWMREELGIVKDDRAYSGASIETTRSAFDQLRDELRDELRTSAEERAKRSGELDRLTQRRHLLERIPFEMPRGVRLPHKGPRTFALILEHDGIDIGPIFDGCRATIEDANGYTLITGARSDYETVREAVLEHNLRVLDLEPLAKNREAELEQLRTRIAELSSAQDEALARTAELRGSYREPILTIDRDLTVLHERYEKPLSFGRTAETFVAEGYVPASGLDDLKRIEAAAKVDVRIEPASDAPVKLTNPRYVRRFEFITSMFGVPRYATTDPTPFVAFFLPLFFGFMFSDVGYGLLLLGLATWLASKAKTRTPVLSDASYVLAVCGASTIAFGLAFGSFFGELVPLPALVIDPFTNAQAILVAALALGLVHMNLGLGIAAVEHAKRRNYARIGSEIAPFLLLQLGAAALALSAPVIGWTALTITVVLLFARSRIMGVMEITGFLGTWFSYARLLALALATAGIALGINIIGERIATLPYVGPVLFVVFIIAGHLFNFVLNVLGSSIHSVRLHYIEFFSQFYEAGGDPYRPFETDEKQHTL